MGAVASLQIAPQRGKCSTRNTFVSSSAPAAVKAMRTIKFCAIAIIGFVLVGEVVFVIPNSDDPPAGIFMGLLITFGSIVVAAAAAMSERLLQNAVDIKSENLTV